jgi:phenylacetate-CoA ligase
MPLDYSDSRLRHLYLLLPSFMREAVAAIYSMTRHRRRFGGVFQSHLAELQANASRTAEEHAADQLRRLRLTLSYADAHVPYYRDLFQKLGFEPEAVRSLSDLQSLPLLDKDTVRSQSHQLLADPLPSRTINGQTGGTSGSPLMFLFTEEANQRHQATVWFHMSWAGIQRGDRCAHFGGHPVAAPDSLRPPFWVLDRYEKELVFSSQHMTPATMPEYARVLADYRPVVINGFPSTIHLMAVYLIETERNDIRPKAVFTWAETLLAYQREAIEEAFGCRVYSSYGNGERTGHLLQCERGNFHVVPETCVVEVLDPFGNPVHPGEMGELVCTSLVERAMPLIRYRIGDTAIAAEGLCSCGRTTSILSAIGGRTDNYILGRDGRRFGPLAHLVTSAMRIKEAQFVQSEPGLVCIRVVPCADYGPSEQARLMEAAYKKFGNQVEVTVQAVDAIRRTAYGKFPFVVLQQKKDIPERSKGLVA